MKSYINLPRWRMFQALLFIFVSFVFVELFHACWVNRWILKFDRHPFVIKPIFNIVSVGNNLCDLSEEIYQTPPAALLRSKTLTSSPAARRWPALTTPLIPAPMTATRFKGCSDIFEYMPRSWSSYFPWELLLLKTASIKTGSRLLPYLHYLDPLFRHRRFYPTHIRWSRINYLHEAITVGYLGGDSSP